jgi:hypothetical protein
MEKKVALAAIDAIRNAIRHDKIPPEYIRIDLPNIDEWVAGQLIEWFVMMQYQVFDDRKVIDGGGSEKWRSCANTVSNICTKAVKDIHNAIKYGQYRQYDYAAMVDLKRENKELKKANDALRRRLDIIEHLSVKK